MTYELMIAFFIGFIVGALLNRSKESREQQAIYDQRYNEYQDDLAYYKRLTKKLVEENMELRK